ncbi:DNA primase catalytic core [Alteromonadaceae bacterium 2753L.S.0a.02]|nr:DNA primase catalytic core [Alteromonadaceae bacterium 2753L.S.0a.02]
MARLPDAQIDRIKQDISLLRLVESQGYPVKKIGKDHAIQCPFHDDDTPSLIISPKTNLYHCFGCGAAGSVIDWVMKTQCLNFREAAVWLSNEFLAFDMEPENNRDPSPSLAASSSDADPSPQDDQALLRQVIDFYHETLKTSSEAQDYLKQRGLDDPELIECFKLGYANRTLGLTLPEKNRKAGAEIRCHLQKVGLYRESGHEHFNGSLVVPIVSESGEITEIYGRKLLNNLRKGTPKHLYLPGPHQGVFNPDCLRSEEIILCEALLDALTFWRHGFKNVTSSYGTAGFTDDLKNAFIDRPVKRVLIAYDRDEAGNTAAEKLAEELTKVGIDCYRILFPKGMDANDYALKMTPARKSLELVIRKAEWMGSGEDPRRLESQSSVLAVADQALPVSPVPEVKPVDVPSESRENETVITFEDRDAAPRRYRVRGLKKATSYEQLKINLAVSDDQDNLHVDQLDLYNAKQRQSFIKQATAELGASDEVIKKDLAKVLLKLEQLQDEQIQEVIKPKEKTVQISSDEQEKALELLRDPSLLSRILEDFNRAGVVGEETNKLVGYLAAVSRKLDNPLAVIIQSTSAAGKSSLMNAVLAMMPEEERIQYSAMTGQSLFYMGETNLKHKILAIAEEEGADQASYALKLLQSEGELTIASTGKDADGNLTTQEYRVEGPVMLFSTTTAIDIDEELMNRCIVLTVNESREQTELIHQLQRKRETLEGLLAGEDKKQILTCHRNAQRLLKPLKVVNPFAEQLTFMSNQTRSRRDHMKYLQLIKTIAFLHQYQRHTKTVQHQGNTLEYIEVALSDIAVANELAHEVLGRSLDELPPQTRKLLTLIHEMVSEHCQKEQQAQKDYRFSRRDIREYTGWGLTQVATHCQRLEAMEYLVIYSGRNGQKMNYELCYYGEGDQRKQFMLGLINVEKLGYDGNLSGLMQNLSEGYRATIGVQSDRYPQEKNAQNPINTVSNAKSTKTNGKTHSSIEKLPSSHPNPTLPLVAPAHPEPATLERPCSSAAHASV